MTAPHALASTFDPLVEPLDFDRQRGRVFLVLPAMGVAASFYAVFAQRLSGQAHAVVAVAELRGQGRSAARAEHGADYSYTEIVEQDIPRYLDLLRGHYPDARIHIVGHSLGGQLATLALAHVAARIDSLILVAAGTAHYRAWARHGLVGAWLLVHGVRLAARLLPYYPGRRLGFGGNQPRAMMRDWSSNATDGRYRLHRSPIDYERVLRAVDARVLAINIAGDVIAPKPATDALVARLPAALVDRETVELRPGYSRWQRHFSWAREPDAIVRVIDVWTNTARGDL